MLSAYAQLATAMILVGGNVGVAKLLAEALPIPMIACLRCLLACAVLWPLARLVDGRMRPEPREMLNLALQAAAGTVLYNAALLAGLRLTTALEGGLMLATLPAVVALGSAFWLRERLPARQWLAAGLAVGGMAAIAAVRASAEGVGSLLGNALILVAVTGEAAYVLLAKRIAGRVPVITASFWMQAFSFLLLVPLTLPVAGAVTALAAPGIAGLLVFHSLTASVLCLLLWYGGLKRAPAGVAGIFSALLPASAAAVAILLLGEQATLAHAAGFALMLASVLLATWPGRRR